MESESDARQSEGRQSAARESEPKQSETSSMVLCDSIFSIFSLNLTCFFKRLGESGSSIMLFRLAQKKESCSVYSIGGVICACSRRVLACFRRVLGVLYTFSVKFD